MTKTNDPTMIVYKFGTRRDKNLSPRKGIELHLEHALRNSGRVLLTMGRFPIVDMRDKLTKLMMTTRDGSYAIIADIDDLGPTEITPPEGYTVPSIWLDEDKKNLKGWFALSNLIETELTPEYHKDFSAEEILRCISGQGYMTYVKLPKEK